MAEKRRLAQVMTDGSVDPGEIVPGSTDRVFVCGTTGSGKSTGLKKLMAVEYGKKQIILFDTKADPIWGNLRAPVVTDAISLPRYSDPDRYPLVIYRPSGVELRDKGILDAVCEWIYQRGHTMTVFDEVTQVAQDTDPGYGFLDLYSRGRVRGCLTIAATQRPKRIPLVVYTEAEHFFVFALKYDKDRQHVASFTDPQLLEKPPGKYQCWHYSTSTDRVLLLKFAV